MYYSISTTLIYEKYKKGVGCPTCKIRQKVESDLVTQFLNEAVMEDSMRLKVNRLGFCEKHYEVLYAGNSKLGLALQATTRIASLNSVIKKVGDVKSAKKEVEKLKDMTGSCIICELIEYNMKRYYETIARIYKDDEGFRQTFKEVDGYCYGEFIRLLDATKYAGSFSKDYISDLIDVEKNYLNKVEETLREFTDKFDYLKRSSPLSKEGANSLITAESLLYGDKPLAPVKK